MDKIEEFITSLDGYTVEQLSEFIHTGAGDGSLKQARDAWWSVNEMLGSMGYVVSARCAILRRAWRGSAAEAAKNAMVQYRNWLIDAARVAYKTAEALNLASYHYGLCRAIVVTPDKVRENRIEVAFWRSNQLLTYAGRVQELDQEYEFMRERDVAAINAYGCIIKKIQSTLEPFPAPPMFAAGAQSDPEPTPNVSEGAGAPLQASSVVGGRLRAITRTAGDLPRPHPR